MVDREKHITMGNGVRPLDKDYSVDQLASILQLWCGVHEQDLVFGCLMRSGTINLYDNDNTTAATGIVWIYSSNDGQATADDYTDHYEALRRPTVSGSQDSKTSSSSSKKRCEFMICVSAGKQIANMLANSRRLLPIRLRCRELR
ncbi:hypothetical protein B0H65DRAFT_238761 [Neurospora tetraspora]|uniref:Uncharacterized protein n=1 Tax=Neurospora tetraspora TaxID=94610 RepID=A0AAE0JD95_9PEZI|nr:hypothetical protein B0H65DRAFT_238761 [Neurospora tetraspora]